MGKATLTQHLVNRRLPISSPKLSSTVPVPSQPSFPVAPNRTPLQSSGAVGCCSPLRCELSQEH